MGERSADSRSTEGPSLRGLWRGHPDGTSRLGVRPLISSRLELPPGVMASSAMIVPVAMFSLMVGLFLIISRKKALSQVIGYIVLENGIYTFGISFAQHQPLLIEWASCWMSLLVSL